jgi:hypothetical protein
MNLKMPSANCCAGIGRPTGMIGAIGFVLRSFTEEEQKEVSY